MQPLEQSRHLATPVPGPRSAELAARRSAAVAAGVRSTLGVYAARAGGGIIEDVDGNRLIDLGSGIAVTTVGATAPAVVDAVRDQVERFTHTCFMVTPYEGYIAVAEELNRLTPGSGPKRSMLVNSGAEALENAVKIARRHTGRTGVVVFEHAFHGRTSLTMAMTAKAAPYKAGFGPFASEVYRAPGSYPYRDGLVDPALAGDGGRAARNSIRWIESHIDVGDLAALVIEPIHGEGGFIVPAPGFLPELVAWCRANGVVFIADEVQTGFARTGAMFASEHEGIEPDLICTAKALAAGLPMSGVTGRAEIMDSAQAGGVGGTFGGNPVACAAALAAVHTIERDDLVRRAQQMETLINDRLTRMRAADARIGDIRGRGALIAMEFVNPDNAEPDKDLTARLAAAAHAEGVIVLTCGTYGNVIRLLPPLTIGDDLLTEGLDVLADCLSRL